MPTTSDYIERFLSDTDIGFYGTLDSDPGGGNTIVDTNLLRNSNYGSNEFLRWWVWLPASGNVVRPATTLNNSTGVLTTGGDDFPASSGTKYRLLRPEWHPVMRILPLLNRALEECWLMWRTILTLVPNGDGEDLTVGGSDSNATTTRETTPANVFQGDASLRVANFASNGYHQYDDFDAAAGRDFRLGIWCRIQSGTARVQVIDRTNGNAVLAQLEVSGSGQPYYLQLSGSFPADCYRASVRVGGVEANAVTFWDDAFLIWQPQTRLKGPSWVKEWRDDRGQAVFRLYQVSNRMGGDGAQLALAYDLRLMAPSEYQVLNIPSAANPAIFELGREFTQDPKPILIEARRPYASFGKLNLDTDTSEASVRLVVAAMKWLAARDRSLQQASMFAAEYWREQRQGLSEVRTPAPNQTPGLAWQRIGR